MLQEMAEKSGIIPQALLNRPVLTDSLLFFYEQFLEVGRSRTVSASAGAAPLQWGPFMHYCQLHQVERESWLWLWDGIELFDDVWLELQRDKMKTEAEAAKTK